MQLRRSHHRERLCRLVLLALSALLSSMSSRPTFAEGEQWGLRKYAEELPRYRALVQQLEAEGRDLDARRQRCEQAIDALRSDWTVEERVASDKTYESRPVSNNVLGGGRALAEDRMAYCRDIYRQAQEQPNPPDPTGDEPVEQAYRDLLWGAHIKYLRSRNQFYDYDARYQEDRLQFLKSYMTSSVDRYLGFSLDDFIADTLDDAGYVLAAHANAFFDELLKCGVKEIAHYVKQWAVYRGQIEQLARQWTFTERWRNLSVLDPGQPTPSTLPEPGEINELGLADCIEDVTRAMVVIATVNGLRKNFVDEVVDAGVDPLVAEFWWSKYILQEEKPSADDPRAARARSAYDAFMSRLEGALESTLTKDFGLEQAKKSMEDELERQVSKRIYNDVMSTVRKEVADEIRKMDPLRPDRDQVRRLRQQAAERARKLGKEKVKNDAHLKFLDGLDWGVMLVQQGISSNTYVNRWYDFDGVAADLVEEYHRVENCMVKQKLALSGPAILAIYQMPEKQLQEFFSHCDDIEANRQMLWAQRLLPQMQRHHNIAKAAADQLMTLCADGPGRLQDAWGSLIQIGRNARTILEHAKSQRPSDADVSDQLESLVQSFETRAQEAAQAAEAVVQAKNQAETEAEKACASAQDFRSTQDDTAREAQQQQCEAAVKSAEQAVADAVNAFDKSVALRDAVKSEAEQLNRSVENLLDVCDGIDVVLKSIAEVRTTCNEVGEMAAAADLAWARLKKARTDAEAVLKKANEKVAEAQEAETQGLLASIVRMGEEVVTWAASYEKCTVSLRTKADELARDLQTVDLVETALKDQVERLPDKGDLQALENRTKQAVADVSSAADVAEAFLEVAKEAGRDAQTCLNLLIGSKEGGPAEITAAAEAAIDACRLDEARTLIDRLLQGPERDRLMQKLTEAQQREERVSTLRSQAERLARAGDVAGAKSRLQEALSLSVCSDVQAEIDSQLVGLGSGTWPSAPTDTSTTTGGTEPNAVDLPDDGFVDLGAQTDAGAQGTSEIVLPDQPIDTQNTGGFGELPTSVLPDDDPHENTPLEPVGFLPGLVPQNDGDISPALDDGGFADPGDTDSQSSNETVTYFDRQWIPRTWQTGDTQSTQVNIYDTATCLATAAALANYTEGASDATIADQIRATNRHMQAANQYSFAPHKAWPDWEQRAYQFNVWAKRITQTSPRQRDIARKQLHGYLTGQANGMKTQLETLVQGQAGSVQNCDSLLFQVGHHLAYAAQLKLIAEAGLSAGKDQLWANRILSRVNNSKATAARLMGMMQPSANRQGCPDMKDLAERVRTVQVKLPDAGQTMLALWQEGQNLLQRSATIDIFGAGKYVFANARSFGLPGLNEIQEDGLYFSKADIRYWVWFTEPAPPGSVGTGVSLTLRYFEESGSSIEEITKSPLPQFEKSRVLRVEQFEKYGGKVTYSVRVWPEYNSADARLTFDCGRWVLVLDTSERYARLRLFRDPAESYKYFLRVLDALAPRVVELTHYEFVPGKAVEVNQGEGLRGVRSERVEVK